VENLIYRVASFIAVVLISLCLWAFGSVMIEAPQATLSLELLQTIITFFTLPLFIFVAFIIRLFCKITWRRLGLAFVASLLFIQAWGFHSIPVVSGIFTLISFMALYFSVIAEIKRCSPPKNQ